MNKAAPTSSSFGFWPRKYYQPASSLQRTLDLLFGLIAPPLCILFDPIIFKEGAMGGGYLSGLWIFFYSATAIGLGALGFFRATERASVFLSGVLYGAAIVSFLLGILMLPISILGLLFVIGALGFIPLVTGLVLFRNAARCAIAVKQPPQPRQKIVFALGLALALGLPGGLQAAATQFTNHAIVNLRSASETTATRAEQSLCRWRFILSTDKLVWLYRTTKDEHFKQRLATVFTAITGDSIARRANQLSD